MIEKLETIALESGEDVKERYHNRKHTALFNHWSENVARECKKFNKALLKVISSKPTGVNESDMVNMAAAVHLGKTDVAAYRHKDFPAATWKFYRAWLVLKDHPMFAPPKPKKPIVLEDFSDDDDDEEEGGTPSGISESEDTSTVTAAAAAAAATPVALRPSSNFVGFGYEIIET